MTALDDEVRRADQLVELKRYADAEPMFRRVLAGDPDHYGALRGLSLLMFREGRHEELEPIARHMLRVRPDDSDGPYALARALNRLNRYDEAETAVRRLLQLEPESAQGSALLAEILNHMTGRRDEALAAAKRSVELRPERWEGYWALAMVHIQQPFEWDLAVEAAQAAIKHNPHLAQLHFIAGTLLIRLERIDEAREHCMTAIRLDPSPSMVDAIRGQLVNMGVPTALRDVYAQTCAVRGIPDLTHPGAAGDDPELLEAQANVAASMWSAAVLDFAWGRDARDTTRALLAAILAADPRQPTARALAASIARFEQRYEDVIPIAGPLIADGKAKDDTYRHHTASLVRLGRIDEAVATAEAARERFPDSAWAAAALGRVYGVAGRYDEAFAAIEAGIALEPDNGTVYWSRGRVYLEMGEPDLAQAVFEKTIELDPDCSDAGTDLARMLIMRQADFPGALDRIQTSRFHDSFGGRGALTGLAKLALGEWDEAQTAFEGALDAVLSEPDSADLVLRATALVGATEPFRAVHERARETLGRDEEPCDAATPLAFAAHLTKQGAYAEALIAVQEALRIDPDLRDARRLAGVLGDAARPEHARLLADFSRSRR